MTTPNLELPYIAPSQAQKHLTHNEALRTLDAVVQACVVTRTRSAPPASALEGEGYIVAAGASGAWAGGQSALASFQDGSWSLRRPKKGWRVWVADEQAMRVFDGTSWIPLGSTSIATQVAQLGINAPPSAVNRLTVSSASSLLDHAGAGHQLKINKATAADSASLLFQTGYSGRAEIGLPAHGPLAVKVSANGETWLTALSIDTAAGTVDFPQGSSSPQAVARGGTGATTALGALGGLGLRYTLLTLADDTMAEVNFGGLIYGSVILLVGNTTAVPLGTVFARMAPAPQLVPLGVSGGVLGVYTVPLSGTTGTDGQVNMAALDGGRFQIENRRGYAISYTLYLFR